MSWGARKFWVGVISGTCVLGAVAVPPREAPLGPPTAQELADGQELAQRLRSSVPTEPTAFHGKLIISRDDSSMEIPVECKVVIGPTNWETDYSTVAVSNASAEKLRVVHTTNAPNEYFFSHSSAAPVLITTAEANMPLAGSDFSLADLGLDFLHWPVQRQLPGKMRLGQPCYVLESSDPTRREITRVKSYIDKDSGGPLIVEAYDAAGHEVKEYSLHGSGIKKVNGRWQVERLDISNKKTHSHTTLKFDLDH